MAKGSAPIHGRLLQHNPVVLPGGIPERPVVDNHLGSREYTPLPGDHFPAPHNHPAGHLAPAQVRHGTLDGTGSLGACQRVLLYLQTDVR